MTLVEPAGTIAVAYLLRGADQGWQESGRCFLSSYLAHDAGIAHHAYVLIKGFDDPNVQAEAEAEFAVHGFTVVQLADDSYDVGAYMAFAAQIPDTYLCLFNTRAEILAGNWLAKFANNHLVNGYTMLAATGSFESLVHLSPDFPEFPNVHLRSNAFFIQRSDFLNHTAGLSIRTKMDAFLYESGRAGISQRVLKEGGKIAVVGRDGRAYRPERWPFSDTFRQASQSNLLIGDNVTRTYENAVWTEKERLAKTTWGKYRQYQWLTRSNWF